MKKLGILSTEGRYNAPIHFFIEEYKKSHQSIIYRMINHVFWQF
jgi:hypothetical protein